MGSKDTIQVGSRKSELALIQTRHVISCLKKIHPHKEFEIVTMSTLGDKVLDIPLPKIGEKSLFTKELEVALATGVVDFVVHSLKDLPTSLPTGMVIGAVLAREDPRDALVLRQDCQNMTLQTLPKDSVIGTSSLRRAAQLTKKFPHLKVENIRGNLNTRLKKLDELGNFNAIILAAAGLQRMGWNHRISSILEEDDLLYAVGQGALAVECRDNDEEILSLLKPLYDLHTALRVITERSFLKTLGGGCSAPVAVTTKLSPLEDNLLNISLTGAVWSLDGKQEIMATDDSAVKVENCERCSVCPYKGSNLEINSNARCANDIECINECSLKRANRPKESNGGPSKKIKSSDEDKLKSAEILKNDPHEHCPVELPVGADFMGKCPYLESSDQVDLKCFVYGNVENKEGAIIQCPFKSKLKEQPTSSETVAEPNLNKESKHFVGLAPHPDIPETSLDEAVKLGTKLAEKLMRNGATEVMAKAQAIIRGS